MEALLRELWQLREIQELAQLMESGGGPALVTGLSPVHRAMTAAALRLKSGRPLLMLCADEGEARRQAADLRSLTGREPVLLTGRELHWRELAAVSRQWEYRRLEALYRIRQEESPVIVTTADALALRCIPPQVLERCSFTLRSDGRYQVEELARQLTAAGYTRTEQVEVFWTSTPPAPRPRCGANFLTTRWTHWASSTSPPSGGRRTAGRRCCCRPARYFLCGGTVRRRRLPDG